VTPAAPRPRAALGALLLCAAALAQLSGCTLYNRVFHRGGSASCHEHPFIGNADSRPGLKVPEGLSAPDTRNAVKIPALPTAEPERSKDQPCLAQPPKFYAKPAPAAVKPAVSPVPVDSAQPPPAAPTAAPPPPSPSAPAGAAAGGDVAPPGD
jgi:hypothetical protein